MLFRSGIFRSFTGDFIRKTIQQVFPPEFVHGFLWRNMQSFRIFLLHTGGPPQKGPGRTAVRGNKPVKEFKNSFLTPDLVRTAQLQLYLPNIFPERFQMPDTGGFRAETTAQQAFTYHYFPRMGGIDTAIVHTPVIMLASSDKISPNIFSVRITSNWPGFITSCIAQLSTSILVTSTSG